MQMVSRSRGTRDWMREGATGSTSMTCLTVSIAEVPLKGGRPVSIS